MALQLRSRSVALARMIWIALPSHVRSSCFYFAYLPSFLLSHILPFCFILMPSVSEQQQLFKKDELPKTDTPAKHNYDNTAVTQHRQPTMGSITSLGPTGSPFQQVVQKPKEHLFYESFLESISTGIDQYLAMKKNDQSKGSTNALPPTSTNLKRRSGAKPEGVGQKRSKRNST